MTFLKKAKVKAFTLVEMLVVLLIISVLFLLFVPNLTKQKEAVNDKGKAAVVKVVESQAELYSLEKNEDASLSSYKQMDASRKNRLKLIMNTILKMEGQIVKSMIKAFTMLESLLVLGLVSILALGLSSSVQSTFAAVEEQIFFMEFEELYRETQKRSVASQQKTSLNLDGQTISNGSQKLTVPKGIQALSGQNITFDRAGGNSSLAKVEFQTSKGAIRYQLYLGNGKIKRIKETKN